MDHKYNPTSPRVGFKTHLPLEKKTIYFLGPTCTMWVWTQREEEQEICSKKSVVYFKIARTGDKSGKGVWSWNCLVFMVILFFAKQSVSTDFKFLEFGDDSVMLCVWCLIYIYGSKFNLLYFNIETLICYFLKLHKCLIITFKIIGFKIVRNIE